MAITIYSIADKMLNSLLNFQLLHFIYFPLNSGDSNIFVDLATMLRYIVYCTKSFGFLRIIRFFLPMGVCGLLFTYSYLIMITFSLSLDSILLYNIFD